MSKLTEDVKRYVVQRLAVFDTPKEIADAVKEEFGVEVSRQAIENYDPEKRPKLAKEWRELHAATREAFLSETSKEPAAHRAWRVRQLAKMEQTARRNGNVRLAKELLEQIAKETGGIYTNRREVTGKDGAPLVPTENPLAELSVEQLAAMAQQLAGGKG